MAKAFQSVVNIFFSEKFCDNYHIVLGQTRGGGSIPSAASLSPCACLTMLFTLFTIIITTKFPRRTNRTNKAAKRRMILIEDIGPMKGQTG